MITPGSPDDCDVTRGWDHHHLMPQHKARSGLTLTAHQSAGDQQSVIRLPEHITQSNFIILFILFTDKIKRRDPVDESHY